MSNESTTAPLNKKFGAVGSVPRPNRRLGQYQRHNY